MKELLLISTLFFSGLGFAQTLPDAPQAPKTPIGFGKLGPANPNSGAGLSVTENEALSHVLTRPQQIYPPLASINKIEGDVVVETTIDPQGNVSSAKAVYGQPALTATAVQYVKQWIFRPFYSGETRVPVTTQVTVHYSLYASQSERDMETHFQATYWPAWRAGEDALAKQDFAAARQQYQIARDEAAKVPQANWQELANALARLGAVEYRQKNYAAAEPYLLQALQVEQNHRDAEAPEIADALGNLGQLYMAQQAFGKAEPILLKSVEIYEAQLQNSKLPPLTLEGVKRHRVLNLFMLASLNQEMGAGDDAVKYCDMVLGDAPRSMAKSDAVLVIRTCETVYRKNFKLSKSHEAEKAAEELENK